MYGYGYSYPNNTQGSGLMGNYEAGVRTDGGFFAFPIDTGLASRLEALGLLNASSLVNSCNAGKADVLYNLIPTPVQALDRFTVVRSTVKNVLNSSGVLAEVAINTPAFEFNTDGTYRGLLVEPAGTNLALQSQTFDSGTWSKTNVTVTANNTTAPDGTLTADLLINDGVGTFPRVSQTVSTSGVVTLSAFIKKNVGSLGVLFATGTGLGVELGSNIIYNYNLDTNVLTKNVTSGATATSTRVEAYPNGWYRVSITFSSTTVTDVRFYANYNSATAVSYFIWGAQLETGSVATSYIPTVASTQTRTADSVTLTGASSLIGQTSGGLYVEFMSMVTGANPGGNAKRAIALSNGTATARILIQKTTTDQVRLLVTNTTDQADIVTATNQSGLFKVGVRYGANDFALVVNGTVVGTDVSGTVPACSQIDLGGEGAVANSQLNGHLRAAVLFLTPPTNATLQALTA